MDVSWLRIDRKGMPVASMNASRLTHRPKRGAACCNERSRRAVVLSCRLSNPSFSGALDRRCLRCLQRCPQEELVVQLAANLQCFAELCGKSTQGMRPSSREMAMAQWMAAAELLSAEQLGPLVQQRLHTCQQLRELFTRQGVGASSSGERMQACLAMVHQAMDAIRGASAYQMLLQQLELAQELLGLRFGTDCKELRVFCLGSIRGHADFIEDWAEDPPAAAESVGHYWSTSGCLWQLAFALLLKQQLLSLHHPPVFSDPCFTPFDQQLIDAAGGKVLDAAAVDFSSALLAATPTLLYMPHCVDALCRELLEVNWRHGTLHNVVLLGNSLPWYAEMVPEHTESLDSSVRDKLKELVGGQGSHRCVEFPVPDIGRIHQVGLLTLQVFPRTGNPPAAA